MKERPILFSAPMVQAILDGRKTQTRRAIKLPLKDPDMGCEIAGCEIDQGHIDRCCPYGHMGDRLWVRETFMDLSGTGIERVTGDHGRYAYAADTPPGSYGDQCRKDYGLKWRPSIFMPKSASRISLEVMGVRVERLRNISRNDAIAEGVRPLDGSDGPNYWTVDAGGGVSLNSPTAQGAYSMLWDWINGPSSWAATPWVWVVEFRRV